MGGLTDLLVNDKSGKIHGDCFLNAYLLCKAMPVTSYVTEDFKSAKLRGEKFFVGQVILNSKQKCADTIGTVPVPGHFQR